MRRNIPRPEATHDRTVRDVSVVSKRHGRRRRPRSTGRYPFLAAVNDYMGAMEGVLAPSTWKERERRLRRMNKDLLQLEASKQITSANPEKMTDRDVLAYISALRSRGLKDNGMSHNVDALTAVLRWVGNGAADKARQRFSHHFPRKTQAMLDPMDDDERERVIKAAMQVDVKDWRRMEAYGLCVAAICSGLRPKEIRNATVLDLDLNNEVLHAEMVKGKNRYGEPRDSAIHPDGIPFLRRYLAAREAKLRELGLRTDTLFPAIRSLKAGKPDVYSANSTTVLRGIVQGETGVTFNLQKTRRTWGQVALDDGVPLDAVSRMMGHKTSRTTETYYARKRNNKAVAEAKAVWSKAPQPPAPSDQNPKKPLIENQKWMTGYA